MVELWLTALLVGLLFSCFWIVKAALLYHPGLAVLLSDIPRRCCAMLRRLSTRLGVRTAPGEIRERETSTDGSAMEQWPSCTLQCPSSTSSFGKKVQQSTLEWSDICVTVNKGGHTKPITILHAMSAAAFPFEVLVILGPSGAGKSTLLDILASRNTRGETAGKVTINGRRQDVDLDKTVTYIPQDTRFVPSMTAGETLSFYAAMLLPACTPTQQLREEVADALAQMGLTKHSNTLVGGMLPGGLNLRGLSGGELKRLGIAAGIVGGRPIVVLDEPTTGLDSFAAMAVMEHMHDLAASGRTLLATLHQPRAAIWNLVDQVLVLSAGRMLYWGSAAGMAPWFSSHCEVPYNPIVDSTPSEWVLDLLAGGTGTMTSSVVAIEAAARVSSLDILKRNHSKEASQGDSESIHMLREAPGATAPGTAQGNSCPQAPASSVSIHIVPRKPTPLGQVNVEVTLGEGSGNGQGPSSQPGDSACGVGALETVYTAGGDLEMVLQGTEVLQGALTAACTAVGDGEIEPQHAEVRQGASSTQPAVCAAGVGLDAAPKHAGILQGAIVQAAWGVCRAKATARAPMDDAKMALRHAEMALRHAGMRQGATMQSGDTSSAAQPLAVRTSGGDALECLGCPPPGPSPGHIYAPPLELVAVAHSDACHIGQAAAAGGYDATDSPGSAWRAHQVAEVGNSEPGVPAAVAGSPEPRGFRSAAKKAVEGAAGGARRWLRSYVALAWRDYLAVSRNPADVAGRVLLFVTMAVLNSLLNYGLPDTAATLSQRISGMFRTLAFYLLIPFVFMSFFTSDKMLYMSDVTLRRLYRPSSYLAAKLTVMMPLNAFVALLHGCIVYGMLGLRPHLPAMAQNLAISVLLVLIALQVMQLFAVVSPNQDVAYMLCVSWTAFNILVCSYFQRANQMTLPGVLVLRWASAFSTAWDGILVTELRHKSFNCSTGMGLEIFGLNPKFLPRSNQGLLANPLLLRTIARPGNECVAKADVVLHWYGMHDSFHATLEYLVTYLAITCLMTYLALVVAAHRKRGM